MSFTKLANSTVPAQFSKHPRDVGIEITGRCQLHCTHCFNNSSPQNTEDLSFETITRLLDEMAVWGADTLRISGGEPTVHPDFRAILAECERRHIRVGLNTHGVYSSSMLEYLKHAPVDLFFISIDGLEARNDEIRGRGTFQRAVRTCRALRAAGQQVMISFHVCRNNRDDVGGLIDLARALAVDLKVSPLRPIGRARALMPDAVIAPEDYLRVVEIVTAARTENRKFRLLTDFDILDASLEDSCERQSQELGPKNASCKAGRTMVHVNYDGEIYPCAFFATPDKSFSAGNIRDTTITSLWRDSPAFEPFRVHSKSKMCGGCGHYGTRCAGGCPAVSHFATGYLDNHDPTCFVKFAPEIK